MCTSKEFAARLSEGDRGVLEVRYHGVWGTVCDDTFGAAEAHVLCTSIGYTLVLITWTGHRLHISNVHGTPGQAINSKTDTLVLARSGLSVSSAVVKKRHWMIVVTATGAFIIVQITMMSHFNVL